MLEKCGIVIPNIKTRLIQKIEKFKNPKKS